VKTMPQDFERFYPVYREGDQLVRSEVPVSEGLRDRIMSVLAFYEVPFRQDGNGELLIATQTARDLDLLWNLTSKADDPEWFTQQGLSFSRSNGR
jgi:hypothetical protein